MRYSFHPAADRELLEAFNYYEDRVESLGYGFLDEVEKAIQFLLAHPEAAPRVGAEVRSYTLDRFSYSLIYRIRRDRLRILAVAHQSRRPYYWIGRLG
jgi:plasmid stabilization system protein ParE